MWLRPVIVDDGVMGSSVTTARHAGHCGNSIGCENDWFGAETLSTFAPFGSRDPPHRAASRSAIEPVVVSW